MFLCAGFQESKKTAAEILKNFDRIFKDSWILQLGIFRELAGELCEPVTYMAKKSWKMEYISILKRGKRHHLWNELIICVRKNAKMYSWLLSKKEETAKSRNLIESSLWKSVSTAVFFSFILLFLSAMCQSLSPKDPLTITDLITKGNNADIARLLQDTWFSTKWHVD